MGFHTIMEHKGKLNNCQWLQVIESPCWVITSSCQVLLASHEQDKEKLALYESELNRQKAWPKEYAEELGVHMFRFEEKQMEKNPRMH